MLTQTAKNEINTLIKKRKGSFFSEAALYPLAVNGCTMDDIHDYLNHLERQGVIKKNGNAYSC